MKTARLWMACLAACIPSACGPSDSEAPATELPSAPTSEDAARLDLSRGGWRLHGTDAHAGDAEEPARLGMRILDEGGFQLEQRFDAASWRPADLPGTHRAKLAVNTIANRYERANDVAFVDDAGAWSQINVTHEPQPGDAIPDRTYAISGDEIFAGRATGAAPDRELTLTRRMTPLVDADGIETVFVSGVSGPGLLLVSGAQASRSVQLQGGERLRFALATQANVSPDSSAEVEVSVVLDGAEVGRFTQRLRQLAVPRREVLELDDVEPGAHELTIAVSGPPALVAVLAPRIEPSDETARESELPDIVLFVADTFRADNLALWRGHPGGEDLDLAPYLDGLVARSLGFKRAWSTASTTLPAHASMFSSLYPAQHQAYNAGRRLPKDTATLARLLRERGYRTEAITDGGLCSALYGLEQGFELFLEGPTNMRRTTGQVQVALADDDPRPLFLFVQTYRMHAPYYADEAARARVEEHLDELASFDELVEMGAPLPGFRGDVETFADPLRALYLAGLADFDSEFEELMGTLESAGIGSSGYFVLTSDHGEAFGEWGKLWHGSSSAENQLRVPLFMLGPGIEPGVDTSLASLVDLAPTIAAWADCSAPSEWIGRDLLSEPAPKLVAGSTRGGKWVDDVLIGDGRKLHRRTQRDGELRLGPYFDLAADPGELVALREDDEAWPVEWIEEIEPAWKLLFDVEETGETRAVGDDERARLQALGYMIDEE